MWPLKKKEKKEYKESLSVIQARKDQEMIDELRNKFPIGSTFEYLGLQCLVTSTSTINISKFNCRIYAELKANYADNNGVIRKLVLGYSEAMALGR